MAGRYPESWVEDLRSRADLVQVVSSYVVLKKNGRKFWGLCPFHGEKTASFSVDPERQLFYCFGCKKGGTVFTFISEMEHLSYPEAIAYVAEQERVPLPEMVDDPDYLRRQEMRRRLEDANREAALYYHRMLYAPEGRAMLDYLRSRGVDDPTIRRFGLGASPPGRDSLLRFMQEKGYTLNELRSAGLVTVREDGAHETSPARDMFRGRLMFPIINQYGKVLGFGGRVLDDSKPKYLNTGDTMIYNKRHNVYAANLLKKERNLRRAILVEGYMDVIALSQFGIRGVVATLGTALTPEQARLLKRFVPMVYLSYDGDSAGQNAILKGLPILENEHLEVRVLDYPDGLDPDEFIRQKGPEAFNALPVLSPQAYRIRLLAAEYDLTTQTGREDYARACGPVISTADPVLRENLIRELHLRTGFSLATLQAQVHRLPGSEAVPLREPVPVHPEREKEDEDVHTQEIIISLLAQLDLSGGEIVGESDFTDPFLLSMYRALMKGTSGVSLVDRQETEQDRQRVSRILQTLPESDTNERIEMLRQSIHHLRQLRSARQMNDLRSRLSQASDAEKAQILSEIARIKKEQL